MRMPEGIGAMLDLLENAGYSAYLVGGCVRDAVLGIMPHDFDIATNARPDQIIAVFGKPNCTEYGRAFGTVGVKFAGEFAEITTYRTEKDYRDGRHPETVDFAGSITDDLARRDFTCNAMAYSPKTGLFDPFGGREDLKNRILRCVGTPQARFQEDALRILRGLRFCARFGFRAESLTEAAMRAGAFRLEMISAERVFSELMGILSGDHVTQVLLEYPEILSVRIPEIAPCIAFSQHSRHHDFTVWEHTARAVGNAPKDAAVRLAMLLHDIGKPACFSMDERGGHFKGHAAESAEIADKILLRLRCDNKMRELAVKLISLHREIPKSLADVRRVLGILEYDEFSQFLAVLEADNSAKLCSGADEKAAAQIRAAGDFWKLCREQKLCCRVRELAVNGRDLAAMGLHGREIGDALKRLLEAVITEKCPNVRKDLLEYCRNFKLLGEFDRNLI